MANTLSPLPVMQFNQGGVPLNGGKLFTYIAGTTTKLTTYTDATGGTPNTNPIILDSNGQCSVWLVPSVSYKLTLSPATDTDPPTNPFWTEDHIVSASPTALISYAPATGTGDAIIASPVPAVGALTDGLLVAVAAAATNTTTNPTLNVSGLGAKTIFKGVGVPLAVGDIVSGLDMLLLYTTGTGEWILLNPATIRTTGINYAPAGGTGDAITATPVPAVPALTDGLLIAVGATAANTVTNPTFNVSGLGAKTIFKGVGVPLAVGDIVSGLDMLLLYTTGTGEWILLNPMTTVATGIRYAVATGTGDIITATPVPALAALTDGLLIAVGAGASNTITNPTLNVSGLGAKTVYKGAGVALVAGDIASGLDMLLLYVAGGSGAWILLNPLSITTSITGILYGNGATAIAATIGTGLSLVGSTLSNSSPSDYRIKRGVTLIDDATTLIDSLRPVRYNYVTDEPDAPQTDGFIAHELQAVIPGAVTGVKDGVDGEGHLILQQVYLAGIIPVLTSALQDCIRRIDDLEVIIRTGR